MSAFMTIKIVMKFSTRIPCGGKKASRDNELKQMISQIDFAIFTMWLQTCGWTDGQTDGQNNGQTDRMMGGQTNKWIDMQHTGKK